MGLSELFIDVSTLPTDSYGLFQLLSLGLVYGYILFNASNLISDGSELLLLVPSVAGLVGSLVTDTYAVLQYRHCRKVFLKGDFIQVSS